MPRPPESPLPIGSIVRVRDPGRGASRRVRKLFGRVGLVALVYASFVAVEFPADGTRVLFGTNEVEPLADDDEDPRGPTG